LKELNNGYASTDRMNEIIAANYPPRMSFYNQFENKGGVAKIITVAIESMKLWKNKKLADSWEMWLKELDAFSNIPQFFGLFLKTHKSKELLFKILGGAPDQEDNASHWEKEQKEAVQVNYRILAEVFQQSGSVELREKAISQGIFETILDRLGKISGEKPRTYEEEISDDDLEKALENADEMPLVKKQSKKAEDRKARKGVGYSAKQGETFDVAAYLENKKTRNEQIQTLVDILAKLLLSDEWKASNEVAEIILESPLLPLLEHSLQNAWLDMAKTREVYHSYLSLIRSIASQDKLAKCLNKIGKNYKPA
jgi:hypothetical protein